MCFARRGVLTESRLLPCSGQKVQNSLSRWMSSFPNFLAGKTLAPLPTDSAAVTSNCWCSKRKARAHRENWQTLTRESQGCKQFAGLALAQGTPATTHCVDMKSLHGHRPWCVLEQASPAPVLVALKDIANFWCSFLQTCFLFCVVFFPCRNTDDQLPD